MIMFIEKLLASSRAAGTNMVLHSIRSRHEQMPSSIPTHTDHTPYQGDERMNDMMIAMVLFLH